MNSLPQFLQRYKAYIHHTKGCSNDSIRYSGDIWPPADSIHWNFGDPASGINNTSNSTVPAHKFSAPGTYTVELWVRHIDKRTDTTWQQITISAVPTPAIGPDQSICNGDSVQFDAGACTGCTFEWKNIATGVVVGTNQTYTATTAGDFRVLVTNTSTCQGSDTVSVSFSPPPQVTTNPLYKTICSGESTNIALASTVSNTIYHWTASLTSGTVSGFSADSGLVINQILTGSGVVNYNIIPKLGNCVGDAVDFTVTVTPGDSVKVAISADLNNICAGSLVTYSATPTGPGTLSYQWKVNGINKGINNSIYSYSPLNGDIVSCVLSSSETVCVANNPATSNAILMIVNPVMPVSVTISTPITSVCAGTSVIFTATPTNGGAPPMFQWKVNGGIVGTNSPNYTYMPLNGDIVTCILTSNALCATGNPATSNPVTMTVNPNLVVAIGINASNNPVCAGIPVTFTATPGNEGPTPVYQWKVNGINAGTSATTYTYTPNNGDNVSCSLTTSLACALPLTVIATPITMAISPTPVVNFPLCFDSITTLNAKPIQLRGGVPFGGTYAGPGVNSLTGVFTPSLAGIGTKTITYSYTNVGLCTSFKSKNILVQTPAAFTCGNPFTDIRDHTVYQTIQIGTQCWFAENLDYGVEISSNQHQRDNCINEKYTLHPSPLTSHSFYQWDEVMQYTETPGDKGLCPPAWHVPAENDWNTLFSNWSGIAFAGSPLKSTGFSGFNALLNGASHQNTSWDYNNFAAFFWTSTPHGAYKAWSHGMNNFDASVSSYPSSRANAFSVRCVKD